jgi:hypothetical protein
MLSIVMLNVVMLRIDMLCVFILSFVFPSDDILSIGMLSIISLCRYAENHYTEKGKESTINRALGGSTYPS